MKNAAKIIAISFFSGIIGAFSYQQFLSNPPVKEIIREVPAQLEQANYTPNGAFTNLPEAAPGNFREAASKTVSSVVYIKNIQRNRRSYSYLDYFMGRRSSEQIAIGSGSGVIYSSDGYIITNNHVIDGAEKIEVLHEKRTYEAELVGTDPKMDIALLKINAENLPAIEIGSSADVEIGDWVLAVGNPFNLTSTVTAGIVSAIGSETNSVRDNFPIELYIQTDAAINPGNSGGALVNVYGELVGINTSIISQTGSYAGYGFAVPSDVVSKIAEDLKNYRFVQKAYTGAELIDINEELARKVGLGNLNGVFIESVKRGSAADVAGLETRDVVTHINSKQVASKSSFDEILSRLSPGDRVRLEYIRDGRSYETSVTLENVYGNTEILSDENGLDAEDIYTSDFLGAEMRKLTQGELRRYNLRNGVKVTRIGRQGFLQKLDDFEEGYVITAINRRAAVDPEAVANYIKEFSGRISIEVINNRGYRETLRYIFR